jgi:4-hydroxy-tetrahydrodipicolinate synthase
MFTREGDIDEAATARHVDYLIRGGAHGIVACGSSGEFVAMSPEEQVRVIRLIIDAAAGRVPIVASTGHYSTRHTIAMTQEAEAMGAAAALVTLPYYQKPPKPSVLAHYRALRRHTGLPLLVYNNPLLAGCEELTPRDLCALWREGVAQGVKSTVATVVPVHDLRFLCDDSFRVFYGSFDAPMEALLAGAHGWISGFLNFLTRDCVTLWDACAAGDVPRAREAWNFLLPFKQLYTHRLLGPVNDLAIYRAGLDLLGETGGWSRLPFEPLTAEQREELRKLMVRQGVLR